MTWTAKQRRLARAAAAAEPYREAEVLRSLRDALALGVEVYVACKGWTPGMGGYVRRIVVSTERPLTGFVELMDSPDAEAESGSIPLKRVREVFLYDRTGPARPVPHAIDGGVAA